MASDDVVALNTAALKDLAAAIRELSEARSSSEEEGTWQIGGPLPPEEEDWDPEQEWLETNSRARAQLWAAQVMDGGYPWTYSPYSRNPVEWPVGREQVGFMLETGAVLHEGGIPCYWDVWARQNRMYGVDPVELLELGWRVAD